MLRVILPFSCHGKRSETRTILCCVWLMWCRERGCLQRAKDPRASPHLQYRQPSGMCVTKEQSKELCGYDLIFERNRYPPCLPAPPFLSDSECSMCRVLNLVRSTHLSKLVMGRKRSVTFYSVHETAAVFLTRHECAVRLSCVKESSMSDVLSTQ